MFKFITLLVLATSLGCASPETLGDRPISSNQLALTATPEASATSERKTEPPSIAPSEPVGCLNGTPEVEALGRAEAEAVKKRPIVPQVSGYRIPAALKTKRTVRESAPRTPLPELKASEKERAALAIYDEEYAKLEKKHAGDPRKLRDEAWAIKRKLLGM